MRRHFHFYLTPNSQIKFKAFATRIINKREVKNFSLILQNLHLCISILLLFLLSLVEKVPEFSGKLAELVI